MKTPILKPFKREEILPFASSGMVIFLLFIMITWGIFSFPLQKAGQELVRSEQKLLQVRLLLARTTELESVWGVKKSLFESNTPREGFTNEWIDKLIKSAQSRALVIDKVEPAGTNSSTPKKMTVYISSQGDIQKMTAFLYGLMENDPLARVESFSIKPNENTKKISFEFMLSKTIQ